MRKGDRRDRPRAAPGSRSRRAFRQARAAGRSWSAPSTRRPPAVAGAATEPPSFRLPCKRIPGEAFLAQGLFRYVEGLSKGFRRLEWYYQARRATRTASALEI